MATNNGLNTSLSGQSGEGEFVGTDSPTIDAPYITGWDDGSSAVAGDVGEIISSIYSGSGITITSPVPTNITSIDLTPGDWDVWGNVYLAVPATTLDFCNVGVGPTSATLPSEPNLYESLTTLGTPIVGVAYFSIPIPACCVTINSTTTYYLIAQGIYSSGTLTGTGRIIARRRR